MSKKKQDNIIWYAQRFTQYEIPHGGLPVGNKAAHALFRYAVTARQTWERERTMIRYEHELEDKTDYRQLMSSIARMYGVEPEEMIKHWKAVDFTCTMHGIAKLPDEERFRFNRPIKVN